MATVEQVLEDLIKRIDSMEARMMTTEDYRAGLKELKEEMKKQHDIVVGLLLGGGRNPSH